MAWNSIKRLFRLTGRDPALVEGGDFACELHRSLSPGGDGNTVFSPASVRMALGMALLGARGKTAADIARGLRLGETSAADFHIAQAARMALWNDASRPYALVAANAVFVAESLRVRPEARQSLQEGYCAPIRLLDFQGDPAAAAREINTWVREVTRGLLPEIAAPGAIRSDARLVITNALYFKAEWRTKFSRDATHPAPFHLASGEPATVPMMQQTAQHHVWVGPDAEVLEMAYAGDDLAMTFVLPPRGTALADFEPRVQGASLATWLSRLSEERVRVTMPRFRVDGGALSLRGPLTTMGIQAPFDAAVADFGGAFQEPVVIDDVLHRARIDVNEEGTEASAATAVFAYQSRDRSNPRVFAIDRPFLFLLRDRRDGSVLFLGRVLDPR